MMSDSKPISKHVCFFFLLFLCISSSFKLCRSIIVCPEIEKQALLKFKHSLNDSSNVLSSWNISREENCCAWKGVVCSNLTGHVHQLRLQNPDYYEFDGLSGQLNPSILNLKELKYLDLSLNNFGAVIPSFFGFLTSLEYLNLTYAGFHGRIPYSIGNLSNLHTLSLDDNEIEVVSMEWLLGLPGLENLNMNFANLSKVANWVQVINSLPTLVELHLSDCCLNSMAPLKHVNTTSLAILDLSFNYFNYIPMPRWIFQLPSLIELHLNDCNLNFMAPLKHVNTTSLIILDLSGNNFDSIPLPSWIFQIPFLVELRLSDCGLSSPLTLSDGNTSSLTIIDLSWNKLESLAMPRWIFKQPNLISLDLSNNGLEGSFPSTSNTTKLKFIDLSSNNLNSTIPDWLYFCKDLEYVSMAENLLHGKISNTIGNLTSLRSLDLSFNELSGNIPRGISNLCKMQKLDLSFNKLGGEVSGEIPINIGKLSSLDTLNLGCNQLSGNLPESLGQLFNLKSLNIEHNMLEGMVTETHFSNLSKLRYLHASGNHLSLNISSNWFPPFTLDELALGSWNLSTDNIPSWIKTQNSLSLIDLSNTGVSGKIPTWLWNGQIPHIKGPSRVFLRNNRFTGSLPRVANTLIQLDLSNNSFTGGMSHFLCDTTYQTYQLEILYLGGNQLNGDLPDCLMKWPYLNVLNLANNNLSGRIPNSIGFLGNMLSFNLHGNKFSGHIPISMHNCSLAKLDLGGNGFSGNIHPLMGTSLRFLILRSNKLSGEIPSHICHLSNLQILDLSHNAFSGVIPTCVNNFTAMAEKRSLDCLVVDGLKVLKLILKFIDSASVSTKRRVYEYDTILPLVTNIDLSDNNLSGDIPKELTSLVELRSLNLSGNRLTGSIPDRMGDMKQLESLDLSRNSLMGEIPHSFSLMFSLNYLDLSFNNLTGMIPSSTQIMGMDALSFVGNHLCGPPLPNNCSNGDPSPFVDADGNEDGETKIEWVYVFLSLGYAVGLSACCTALVLRKSWRVAYFGLLEFIWDKLYVYFCVKWTRLTTTRAPLS